MDALARPPMQHDGVTFLDCGDARSGFKHPRRSFVAEKVWQEFVRSLGGGDFVELRAANRRVKHLDQHLADAERVRQRDLIDHERLARLRQNRSFRRLHLHARSLFEIDEFVIAGISEMVIEPNPFRRMQN